MPLGGRAEELLEGFRRWLELGYSPRTAQTYVSVVRRYLEFYGEEPLSLDPVEEAEAAIEFIEMYSGKPRSRQVAAYAIKAFYDYLGRPDVSSRIPSPRGAGWTPEPLPVPYEHLKRLIAGLPDPRDRAMLCVAYDLALRRSEVTLLKRTEFNPDTCEIVVYRLKGPKGQPRPHLMKLGGWCCRLLREYLAARTDSSDALFVNNRGEPVSRELVRRVFKRFTRSIGIPHARFHQIRHTAITEHAERTRDVIALAKYAGHRNPQSTMIYIHLSAARVRERLGDSGEHVPEGGG